ncbi:pimeloyl-ACP methyl ester carboxylesterase [Dysgonomonas sp. PFB1-18]|uniref:alpha/beta hydrolase n=1 Tax=unclassified Dysgonomonas TaxID=2630389 RepID=UPI002473F5EE|nr:MULTISPECIES: alpha/beta hydrolase [unclassified Dysgonomonas]MDH6308764.1 pimeloyl-ACP methyl ester carboxylesterase [Dysgonomonas sp. PF1-14]MDH6338539.1 pimeloyl-ACP methyl ester carboxylesterase [Dysgonomonas sp. PF1-16]MDH6380013.1 pimeloyl-ACP methyl ester carboxylesterase [Dysgonomonas sp. PFB1-18]MDH6397367.1 pimeloyl-ACP methyl ester carboxylesterase [Dysgonomonas sp. PF1-23]
MKNIIITIVCLLLLVSTSLSAQLIIAETPISLKTSSGDIHGTLKVPYIVDSKQTPVVLIIAGSGPTDRDGNNPQMKNNSLKMLSDGLYYHNIASLCFDKLGIGESKDAMKQESDLRFEDYINDVRGWIDLLSEDKRFSEIIIAGHSEGSLIGMIASVNNPKVSRYISLAGSGKPADEILREQLDKQLATQPAIKETMFSYIDKLKKGETIADVPVAFNSLFRPSVQPYMISWFKYNPQVEVGKLTIPVLIVQGTTDIQVPVEHADLLAAANKGSQKVIIKNMNHVLKDCESTDMQQQVSTYTNPDIPINKSLITIISYFIKQ